MTVQTWPPRNAAHRTPEADALIGKTFNVLDHGSVTLLDYMGSDIAIEDAARVSFTGGESEKRSTAERTGLIRYLMRHRHSSPFEMVEFKWRIVCPIFVWRQWIRHRTANVNEISGRYAVLPDLYYAPPPERMHRQSASNKQGSAGELIEFPEAAAGRIRNEQRAARESYEQRVDQGMAKELARINVPVSQYTAAVWKIDLHNLFHFLSLRMDPHAQYEIRVFTDAMAEAVKAACPIAWEAFEDFRLHSLTLTRHEIRVLAEHKITSDDAEGYARQLELAAAEVVAAKKEKRSEDAAVAAPAHAFPTTREATEFAWKLRRLFTAGD